MSSSVQQKMKQFQELAKRGSNTPPGKSTGGNKRHDGLTSAIRTKEDAAIFMAELKAATEQSK
ncbi:MAG TPA: hypothetical protein VIM16_05590 [Mucilaginibacter sp.]